MALVAAMHAAELTARGFDVSLISDGTGPGPGPSRPGLERVHVSPHRFEWLRRYSHVPRELAFARAVARTLADAPVQFVIFHGHVLTAFIGPELRRRGIPCAMVIHGDVTDRPPGTYDPLLTRLYRWATPRAYRAASLVVAVSPHMACLAAAGGAQAIRVVPNGVRFEEERVGATCIEREPGALTLGYVGRLSLEKGVDLLLEACALLIRDGVDLRLHVIGGGQDELALKELARVRGLGAVVAFRPPVPRAVLPALYRSFDALVIPSRSDSLPGVVLEALHCGTPVVGFGVGGIPFMVQHEVNGLLVAPESPSLLADALKRLAPDSDLLDRLRRAAKPSVSDFTWERAGQILSEEISHRLTRT